MLSTLPDLILDVLCDHLSYEDVLMLRCTCKSLKTFVDSKKFTTLHLFVRKFSFPRKLFYTGETAGYSQSCHSGNFSILRSKRLKEQFANLQKMTIYRRFTYADFDFSPVGELDLNDLNCFRELTHLDIYCELSNLKGKLSLPKLQIAAFLGSGRKPFELDCPKLRALKINLGHNVTLSSATDQLEYLHYSLRFFDYLKGIGPNLRNLSTIVFESGELLLQFLSDLQTGSLHVPLLSQIRLEDGCLGPLDEVANSLEDLKNDPRTEHITFILMGRLIHSPDELRPIAELKRVYEVENFESHMLYLSKVFKDHLHIDMNEVSEEEFNLYMRQNDLNLIGLKDRSLLFLKRHPELQFLLVSTRSVRLDEDIELDEEIIKKLKNVITLEFCHLFRPSDSITELVIENCKSLQSWRMYHQTVTERLLEMMSEQLLNLKQLTISSCRHETLKPLAKFQNLEYLSLDFEPQRDELQFIIENSRTLEIIGFACQKTETENDEERAVTLLRRTQKPKVHRLTILGEPKQYFYFDTLREMIENYTNDFKQLENYYETTRL